ncbi:MAG: hypothetical protein HY005_03610 [Candidatus Staskawiczbacteria bacterium]|nr:hypothetical protein [Candidatus Staskawiczbacteria bacterium]
MNREKKLPNSTRKFIRFEKARIRRQFLDYKAQEEAIANMYSKILNQPIAEKIEAPKIIESEKMASKIPSAVAKPSGVAIRASRARQGKKVKKGQKNVKMKKSKKSKK